MGQRRLSTRFAPGRRMRPVQTAAHRAYGMGFQPPVQGREAVRRTYFAFAHEGVSRWVQHVLPLSPRRASALAGAAGVDKTTFFTVWL